MNVLIDHNDVWFQIYFSFVIFTRFKVEKILRFSTCMVVSGRKLDLIGTLKSV